MQLDDGGKLTLLRFSNEFWNDVTPTLCSAQIISLFHVKYVYIFMFVVMQNAMN